MDAEQKEDRMLAQKARKGDEQAYAKLFNRYKDTLYYLIYKMVHSKSDAEDLTAEVFDKAHQNLASYNPQYAFSTWLFSIANHHAIDFIRKRHTKLSITTSGGGDNGDIKIAEEAIQSSEPNPEETLIFDQQMTQVQGLLQKLEPHYRQMLELRYFKGYAYWEIAEELKMPIGTVKTQLFRAKNQFGKLARQYFTESFAF